MKKVLILYLSESTGHHTAATSIETGLKWHSDNQIEVKTVNALNYVSPVLEKVIMKTYMGVVRGVPDFWNYLYDNEKVKKRLSRLREKAHRMNSPRFFELIMKEMPDTVICTQAYPCGVLNSFKDMYGFDFSLYAVVTDYVVHSYWILDNVDHYIVPTSEVKDRLIEKGVPEEKIKCFGIPVIPHFCDEHDTSEIKNRYGISSDSSVVTLMGGGHGLFPMKEILNQMQKVKHPLHVIAITGRNKRLYEKLKDIAKKSIHPITVLGYINNVSEIMEISDILLSKPGGMTITEALIKMLPMIIMNPLPGQETLNTEYLLRENIALKIDSVKELPDVLHDLLSNPYKLVAMKKSICAIRKLYPTLKITNHVLGQENVSLLEV